jgi:hypothetical protein
MEFLEWMGVFVEKPWLALLAAGTLILIAAASRSRVALWVALSWWVYSLYEYAMKYRLLCSGECDVRIDLLVLYPVLFAATAIALVAVLVAVVDRLTAP